MRSWASMKHPPHMAKFTQMHDWSVPMGQFAGRNRMQGYQNGNFLERHRNACHKGLEDANCPACRELAAKSHANHEG